MPADWSRLCKCGKYSSVHWPDHPHAWPNGYVYAHRAVIEEATGKFLPKKTHVHHRDGNPRNNQLENLVVLSPSEHHKTHGKDRPAKRVEKVCARCKKRFTRCTNQDHKSEKSYCSRSCYRTRKA